MNNKTFEIVGFELFYVDSGTNNLKMVKKELFIQVLNLFGRTFIGSSKGFIISFGKLIYRL